MATDDLSRLSTRVLDILHASSSQTRTALFALPKSVADMSRSPDMLELSCGPRQMALLYMAALSHILPSCNDTSEDSSGIMRRMQVLMLKKTNFGGNQIVVSRKLIVLKVQV